MESASPFHNLTPHKYVKLRYSPLVATFVEPDVENLFNQCGISFNDMFAVLGSSLNQPLRIIPHFQIIEETQESFFSKISSDMTLFSQSFVFPEYEKNDVTIPKLSPIPDRFPSHFHFPSPEAQKPPWYTLTIERLLMSSQFTKHDFTDIPYCILYATMNSSSVPVKKVDEIRKLLQFPEWMNEFISDIPIVRLIVFDGLNEKIPSSVSGGAFARGVPLLFRSRNEDQEGDLEEWYLKNIFKYDERLLQTQNFCKYLNKSDFDAVRTAITQIHDVCSKYIQNNAAVLEYEFKQSKSFFSKKKLSEQPVQGIPWNKLAHLRLASYYILLQNYEGSRKHYRSFVKASMPYPILRLHAQFMAAICVVNDSNQHRFKEQVAEIFQFIHLSKSIRFLLMVPLLTAEFHASVNEKSDAFFIIRRAVEKITKYWNGNQQMKNLFLALMHERMAGVCTDQYKSFLYTSRAAYLYKGANQISHALRCYIWLFRALPHSTWKLLYQTAWLQKAMLLAELSQYDRSLNDCKELLALPDLQKSLQTRVIKQFWVPFNDKKTVGNLNTRINPLLEIKSLKILDLTNPRYWGLDEDEFKEINERFDHFVQRRMVRSVSFDSWYEDEEVQARKKKKKVHKIGVKTETILTLSLYNRFNFPVLLDKCVLKAHYQKLENKETVQQQSATSKSLLQGSSLVPPSSSNTNEEEDEVFESQNAKLESQNAVLAKEITSPSSDSKLIGNISERRTSIQQSMLIPDETEGDPSSHLENSNNEPKKQGNLFDDENNGKYYSINQITNKEIPNQRGTTDVSFKFITLSEGIFTVSQFIKNYWGKVDTEVECGPLTFVAKDSYPQLTLEAVEFPAECHFGQCSNFSFKLKNTGTVTIKEILVVYDQNDSVTFLGGMPPAKFPNVSIYNTKIRLEPNETETVKGVLWATSQTPSYKSERSYHFMVSANGLRCSFIKKTVSINPSLELESVMIRQTNDTENMSFQTTIKSHVDNLKVCGFIDKNAHLLKTIKYDVDSTLNADESMSIIGNTSDPTEETVEAWRGELGPPNLPISILFKVNDESEYSQSKLNLELDEPQIRFSLRINNTVKVGSKNACSVCLINNGISHHHRHIYIRPLPLRFIDHQYNKHKASKDSHSSKEKTKSLTLKENRSVDQFILTETLNTSHNRSEHFIVDGCKWIGKTTCEFSQSTRFETDFKFIALAKGLYQAPGILISYTPDFVKPITINISTTFQVTD